MAMADEMKARVAKAALAGALEAIRKEFPDISVEGHNIGKLQIQVRVGAGGVPPRYYVVKISEPW